METTEDVACEAFTKLVCARFDFVLLILRLHLLLFPEIWDVFLVAFTDGTLIIVAEALLGPEGAFALQIDLVRSEEWRLFQLAQNG